MKNNKLMKLTIIAHHHLILRLKSKIFKQIKSYITWMKREKQQKI